MVGSGRALAQSPKDDKPSSDTHAQAQAVFDKAKAMYDLEAAGSKPFRLEASYRMLDPDGKILTGSLLLLWKAPDAWRRETVVGDKKWVEIRSGDKQAYHNQGQWTMEEEACAQSMGSEFLLSPKFQLNADGIVKISRHKLPDETNVVDVAVRGYGQEKASGFRFNAETGVLLSTDDSWGFYSLYKSEVRDGRLLPVRVEGHHNEKQVSLWALTGFSDWQPPYDDLLAIPKDMVVSPACVEFKDRPKEIHRGIPKYPPAAQSKGLGGRVIVGIRIGPDGTVVDVSVISSTSPLFVDACLTAVKQFQFELTPCLIRKAPIFWLLTFNFTASH